MADAAHVIVWLLVLVSFSMTWTAMVERSWRVRQSTTAIDPNNEMDELDIVAKTIRRDGLWLTCLAKSSGEWQCDKIGRYNKPNYYGFIIATRMCIGISIVFMAINILLIPFQMPCAFAEEPIKNQIENGTKQLMTAISGFLCFLSAILNVVAISIYGTNVYTEESIVGYNIAVLSWCSYLVIISSLLLFAGAVMMALLYNSGRNNDNQTNLLNQNARDFGGNYTAINANDTTGLVGNNYDPSGNNGILNDYSGEKQAYNYQDDYNTNTRMNDTYMVKDEMKGNFDQNDNQYI